ncbi:MAG: hypothetical protein M3112_05715 [Actinomycetia bacterium]|nr:hypothetical protein [Actinomycetes bacterium]
MRRIPVLLLAAALILGLVPAAASAQTTEEAAAIEALQEALDGLDCVTAEGCAENLAEVEAALELMKPLFPDLDYSGLEGASLLLLIEIDEGTDEEIAAAVDPVQVAGAALIADAEAAAGGGTTTTTVAAPTAVDTGSPVDTGPNMALLGVAALLLLLVGGALVLRRTADRR